jgi:SAM-dependent methyltransferase
MLSVVDFLPRRRPLSVLDLGCSTCEEGEALLASGVRLTLVDRDAVTLAKTAERLAQATCVAADAARVEFPDSERFDVILMRRPDVAVQQAGWHAAFRRLPEWLAQGGRVVVTTPGTFEARIVRAWLEELGAKRIEEHMIDRKDERCVIVAHGVRTEEKCSQQKSLAEALEWDPGSPRMVCDVRTGICTFVGESETPSESVRGAS